MAAFSFPYALRTRNNQYQCGIHSILLKTVGSHLKSDFYILQFVVILSDFRRNRFYWAYYQAFLRDGLNVLIGLNSRKLPANIFILRIVCNRGGERSIIGEGSIFIYSCSAQLISVEIDCFYSLWTRIYEYVKMYSLTHYRFSAASLQYKTLFSVNTIIL